jgi:methyl-accepting chemotaxis protein
LTKTLANFEKLQEHSHQRIVDTQAQEQANVNAMLSAGEKMLAQLEQLEELADQEMRQAYDEAKRAQKTATTTLVTMSLCAVGLAALLGLLITRSIVNPFRQIFRGLKTFSKVELKETADAFNRIIDGMTDGVNQVNDAAGQVSSASQQLAEGASEQASSLEQTSAALEQLAAMTRTNAANAKEANELTAATEKAAGQGDQTMTAINESSDQISKIIKVIEEIAFQTNLLALNAAVEAARAGEHGKGFAVVADEVRNLAQRSAQAAKEITDLIEKSVNRSREGAEAITAIVDAVGKVTELVSGIAQASDEQSQGVDQVNTAVSQMDRVTQQNASGAEESASAAEQLNAQAQATNALVGELIVLVKGTQMDGTVGSTRDTRTPTRKKGLNPAAALHTSAPHPAVASSETGDHTQKQKRSLSPATPSDEFLSLDDKDLKDF